jgi:NADH:ubiquinone oxidoreductase subunit F (NADH-binding)
MEAVGQTERLIERGVGPGDPTLEAHLRRNGGLPLTTIDGSRLLAELERAGLTGRGGAGFPTFKKLQLAQSGVRTTLVVNVMEGEPASAKDRYLVSKSPHLVVDGAEILASALGAKKVVICVPAASTRLPKLLARVLAERAAQGFPTTTIEVKRLSGRYVAGEESALVSSVAGHVGVPKFRLDKSVPLTIGRDTALVQNVETVANIALIARYGADWFRSVGSPEAPGTRLITVSGSVERPGVVEIATGTPISAILELAGPTAPIQAVLVGGYGGTWLPGQHAGVAYAPTELAAFGASMGAGVLVALAAGSCGIRETARIASFMASESSGQCGPCLFGLPAIAEDLQALADAKIDRKILDRLHHRLGMVEGRGACRHPDGVIRLVRSALVVFAADIDSHVRGVACSGSARTSVLTGRLSTADRR